MLLDALKQIVGPKGWSSDDERLRPRLTEWRGVSSGTTPIAVFPANTAEVAAVVKVCAADGVGIVPQGGNTGMCGGAIPDESGEQILLSLARMNRITAIDAANFSMDVEAGCILADVQTAAQEAGRFFALSLSAEGSCQIGGNLATNAGGINVVRYGTARAQVLGLEAVLADGTVVNSLRSLRKDTAGYDLKQLFIGSEGTLGIITAATLKLYPVPAARHTALIAIPTAGHAVRLFASLRSGLGDSIEAFELISNTLFGLVGKHITDTALSFSEKAPWYVLMDAAVGEEVEVLEAALGKAAEAGLLVETIIAKNLEESARLWRIRHAIPEAERCEGPALKHDISVPISRMEEFLGRGDDLLQAIAPGARIMAFGHVGDGNLHYNVALDGGVGEEVSAAIYDLVDELGGSFSAEHGIGRFKRRLLPKYRPDGEIQLMRTLKKALDPANILNPGKVI